MSHHPVFEFVKGQRGKFGLLALEARDSWPIYLASREQADAMRVLARSRRYVDSTRVAIWGWSGGGSGPAWSRS